MGNHVFPGLDVLAASLLIATRGFQIAHFGGFGAFCRSFPHPAVDRPFVTRLVSFQQKEFVPACSIGRQAR